MLYVRFLICSSVLLSLAFTNVQAQVTPDAVRVVSPLLAATLADGLRGSSTLRALVDELSASDVIVHIVGTPAHEGGRSAGAMHFVQAAGGRRYLRIVVNERLPHDARTGMLAHELEHAAEVARAPWILDLRSLAMHYRDIGTRLCECRGRACFETIRARRTEAQVIRELWSARSGVEVPPRTAR
jgi:hypothetical protein